MACACISRICWGSGNGERYEDVFRCSASVAYQPSTVGVFAEFRRTDLEIDHTNGGLTYEDARVGVRVAF